MSLRLGVVIDGSRGFVDALLADWRARYTVDELAHRNLRLPLAQGRVNDWRTRRALQSFLDRHDVVYFEWAGPLLAQASRLRGRARIVVRLHSYELYDHAPRVRWEAVDRVILVSQAMRRRFRELYPAAAGRTTVIYHGLPLDRFQWVERRFGGTVGMLCNVVPIKRVYETVLTIWELKRQGCPVKLRVAGPPPAAGADALRYYAALERLIRELDLAADVTLEGRVDPPERFLSEIDVFVSNSYWEGQPNALLEAMATGCYSLSHMWDGADEVLPAENLFLTDRDLRTKLSAYWDMSDEQRRARGCEMRRIAEAKFDLERIAPRFREVLEA